MESVDATVDEVIAILNDFRPPESVVRIGNGSPTISSRPQMFVWQGDFSVQLLLRVQHPEALVMTSFGSCAICAKEGIPVTERLR